MECKVAAKKPNLQPAHRDEGDKRDKGFEPRSFTASGFTPQSVPGL